MYICIYIYVSCSIIPELLINQQGCRLQPPHGQNITDRVSRLRHCVLVDTGTTLAELLRVPHPRRAAVIIPDRGRNG